MVLTVPDNDCCNLELSTQATVTDLKELITLKLDIDEHEQKLLFKGKQISNQGGSLGEIGLCARSVVYVITVSALLNPPESLIINVKYRACQYPVAILRQEPLEKLENAAASLARCPTSKICLVYCGAAIKGGTPATQNLVNHSIVLATVLKGQQRQLRFRSKSQILETVHQRRRQSISQEEQEQEFKAFPIKEAESIDDIDDELFNELLHLNEEDSQIDSLREYFYAPQEICRRRSTRSTNGLRSPTKKQPRVQFSQIPEQTNIFGVVINEKEVNMHKLKEVASIDDSKDSGENVTALPAATHKPRNPQQTYTPAPNPVRHFQEAVHQAKRALNFA